MGKLSDALKKSLNEREQQKQLQRKQAAQQKQADVRNEALKVSAGTSKPQVPQASAQKPPLKAHTHSLRERFMEFVKSAEYVAKPNKDAGIDARVVCYHNFQSPVADQYRIIRTNLKSYFKKSSSFSQSSSSSNATRILTVSSALHGEGKSVTAANLAVVLSHDLDSKVLLLDADMRKGSANKLLNISVEYGLSEVLTDAVDFRDAIYPTPIANLSILPSGAVPYQPLELLGSKRMKLLFEQLKSEGFTYIIIDTPPLSLFSDAGVVGADSDGIIFVAQAYKTSAPVVRRAKELAENSHAKIIGFILTHTDYHIPNVYGYYQYYKYYNRASN